MDVRLENPEVWRYAPPVMNRLSVVFLSSCFCTVACGPPEGPTGPEKAAAFHTQEAERDEARKNPQPLSAQEATLQFSMCEGKKAPPFPAETDGAVFRAIVFLRITEEGRTAEHCYLALEGSKKYEEKALGDVNEWSYEPEHSGQPRERIVTFRLK